MAYAKGIINIQNAPGWLAITIAVINVALYVGLVILAGFLLHVGWDLY